MPVSAEVEIVNKYGFHVRPTSAFTKMALGFSAAIRVEYAGMSVDGKSIMGLMTLGATQGAKIKISADGVDEADAVKALSGLVAERFGGID